MPLSHGFSCPLRAANSFYSTRWNDPVVPEEVAISTLNPVLAAVTCAMINN
jgi:hypothetical protein